jgi:hypothetical protein
MSKVQAMLTFTPDPDPDPDPPPEPAPNGKKPHDDRPGPGADKPNPNPAVALRPPPNDPRRPPPRGPLLRWVRQGPLSGLWRPWWLLGLVEVVTYPHPRFRAHSVRLVPGCRAWEDYPARAPFWVQA